MIIQRITQRYKVGKLSEALTLLKEEGKRVNAKGHFIRAIRVCSHRSVSDTSSSDFEFENTAEMEASWARWSADPDTQPFTQAIDLLRESGFTTEILDVV